MTSAQGVFFGFVWKYAWFKLVQTTVQYIFSGACEQRSVHVPAEKPTMLARDLLVMQEGKKAKKVCFNHNLLCYALFSCCLSKHWFWNAHANLCWCQFVLVQFNTLSTHASLGLPVKMRPCGSGWGSTDWRMWTLLTSHPSHCLSPFRHSSSTLHTSSPRPVWPPPPADKRRATRGRDEAWKWLRGWGTNWEWLRDEKGP